MVSINLFGKIFKQGGCWGIVPEAQIFGPDQSLSPQYLFGNSVLPEQFQNEGMFVFIAGEVVNSPGAPCTDIVGNWLQIEEISDATALESKISGLAFTY